MHIQHTLKLYCRNCETAICRQFPKSSELFSNDFKGGKECLVCLCDHLSDCLSVHIYAKDSRQQSPRHRILESCFKLCPNDVCRALELKSRIFFLNLLGQGLILAIRR